ncbi:MAG TPA: branched-chain amino acid ABC transporter permease [Ramlibacter sp.]|nr:branched-chain amino acid ABC transporter permease [Ramlibacter sp.]
MSSKLQPPVGVSAAQGALKATLPLREPRRTALTLRAAIALVATAALILLPLALRSEEHAYFIALVGIWTIFAVGFDFAFGVAGLLSFGHAAFFGVGGYVVGLLTLNGMPFFPALGLAAVAGALLALLFSAVSLRASGIFFAIFTLILAQLIYLLLGVKLTWLTGGIDGLPGVPRPELFGVNLLSNWNFAVFVMVIAAAMVWFSLLLRVSPFGQVLSAVRQNKDRARQIGYSVNHYSAAAFMISGAYSAVAGGLNASLISFIGPEALHWTTSGDVLIATLVGGAGTALGPAIGAVITQTMNVTLEKNSYVMQAIFGLVMILFSVWLPVGLWGFAKARLAAWRGRA